AGLRCGLHVVDETVLRLGEEPVNGDGLVEVGGGLAGQPLGQLGDLRRNPGGVQVGGGDRQRPVRGAQVGGRRRGQGELLHVRAALLGGLGEHDRSDERRVGKRGGRGG